MMARPRHSLVCLQRDTTSVVQSSKVRNDVRVEGCDDKGAGGGPTYAYDQPKHALATTLPLHDPLNLVRVKRLARVFWEGGSRP